MGLPKSGEHEISKNGDLRPRRLAQATRLNVSRRSLLRATAVGVAAAALGPSLPPDRQASAVSAGTITTVAGERSAAPFSGDGGLATQAGLGEATALATEASGTIFVGEIVVEATPQSPRAIIRKIDASGHVSRVAGTGTPAYELTGSGWRRMKPLFQGRARDLAPSAVNGLAVTGATMYASLSDAEGAGLVAAIDLRSGTTTLVAGGGSERAMVQRRTCSSRVPPDWP
ncbi:MAG: twin-arginine translocation signal domain-containing protein [Chloroflexi bacterium]|nr:twin-arginine translocation signal domain-containing protein [Chloroflexota bacterium]